jgi:hypothetical protein
MLNVSVSLGVSSFKKFSYVKIQNLETFKHTRTHRSSSRQLTIGLTRSARIATAKHIACITRVTDARAVIYFCRRWHLACKGYDACRTSDNYIKRQTHYYY